MVDLKRTNCRSIRPPVTQVTCSFPFPEVLFDFLRQTSGPRSLSIDTVADFCSALEYQVRFTYKVEGLRLAQQVKSRDARARDKRWERARNSDDS